MSNVDIDVINRVTEALLNDLNTEEAVVDVSSRGGVVTLSGMVPSQKVRRAAEDIARQQEGVITVINELSIVSDEKELTPGILVPPR